MYGLNKPRTKLGNFLDRNKITQEKVRGYAGINRDVMAEICSNSNHDPQEKTMVKVVGALRMLGYDVEIDDFW